MSIYGKGIPELLLELQESSVRYRKCSYKGKGRPRKDDYVILKYKDVLEYQCSEMLNDAFSTHYIN